jgi:phosphoglycerate dehydrogenase-like enzyme
MQIITLGEMEGGQRASLEARLRQPDVVGCARGDCLFLWQSGIEDAIQRIAKEPSLRWVHTRDAGVPETLVAAVQGRGLILTNGSGAHANALAEYVVCALLALYKQLPAFNDSKSRREWRPDIQVEELRGRTVGILGLGAIGQACACLLEPFGVELIGVNRSGSPVQGIDEVRASALLTSVLPQLDALVIAAPLTASTRALIGAAELALLREGAVVINVGRGEILDEDALSDALLKRKLRGAGLDVFAKEPLTKESPLWSTPNTLITPHNIDDTPETARRGLEIFLANLGRWAAGQPLRNVVDPELGY